jgi:hypothetical protein
MSSEQISRRGLATHISLNVEPDPTRPLALRFEMNDDGAQPPAATLSKAIRAAYPPAVLELLLGDLLFLVSTSGEYAEAEEYIDANDPAAAGLADYRKRLETLAALWDKHRLRFYEAHRTVQHDESA